MANHYVFAPEFCNPASGWEKGQVEKNVQDAPPRLWQPMPNAADGKRFRTASCPERLPTSWLKSKPR